MGQKKQRDKHILEAESVLTHGSLSTDWNLVRNQKPTAVNTNTKTGNTIQKCIEYRHVYEPQY